MTVQESVVVLLIYQPFVPSVPDMTGVIVGFCVVTVMVQEFVAVLADASVTCTVKLNTPPALGVPVTAPVLGVRIRPCGRLPMIEKVYGAIPPTAVSAELYATPSGAVADGQPTARGMGVSKKAK